jgi:hypothetical protein
MVGLKKGFFEQNNNSRLHFAHFRHLENQQNLCQLALKPETIFGRKVKKIF